MLNISSISGLRATPRTPPYAAVKAAVIQYTLTQAASLARKGIRVNGIAPGSIKFPGGTWERARLNNPDLYGRILRSIPFGRPAGPAGGDSTGGTLPLFAARRLGHRSEHRRRWRADALRATVCAITPSTSVWRSRERAPALRVVPPARAADKRPSRIRSLTRLHYRLPGAGSGFSVLAAWPDHRSPTAAGHRRSSIQ